jgi:predicted ATP-grasp superfamily ATP-dependent carboligase
LAKPLVGGGGNGIQSLQDQEALKAFLADPQQASGMLLQETIPGEDVALTLLADQGRVFAVMLRKRLYRRRHHSAFSPFVDMEFFHNDWLEALGRRFVTLTGFSGIADFDLKVDFSAQRASFLECDPRMMASVEAAQVFGLNVPYLLIMNAMGSLPPDACIRTEEGNYLTSKSFLECLLRNRWPKLKHKPLRTNFRNRLVEPLNTAAHLWSTVFPPRIEPVP